MKKQTVITLTEQDVLQIFCSQRGISAANAKIRFQWIPPDRNELPTTEITITINEETN